MDAEAIVAMLGLFSLNEIHAADAAIESLPDEYGIDRGAAELRGLLWTIYNDAMCDVIEASRADGFAGAMTMFEKRKASIEKFITTGKANAKAHEFREELDAYGVGDGGE